MGRRKLRRLLLGDNWKSLAKCKNSTDNFFPYDGWSHTPTPASLKQLEKIKEKYCLQCPVLDECFEYALQSGSTGIWGGILFRTSTRKSILTKRRRNGAQPGIRKTGS